MMKGIMCYAEELADTFATCEKCGREFNFKFPPETVCAVCKAAAKKEKKQDV